MRFQANRALMALLLPALAGCASAPLSTEGVAADVTPASAAAEPPAAEGRTVLWGGVIVAAENLEERTRLQVVGYPLDERSQRPLTGREPLGRFLAYRDGYLETAEFGAGRRVTVRGSVTGSERGRVGEADYTFPTVRIEALELWPQRAEQRDGPRIHFGIGVIFSN